jgi:hypothetical protein
MKISVARAGGKAVTKSGNFLLGDYKVEISK